MTFKVNWEKTENKVSLADTDIWCMLQQYYNKTDIDNLQMISGGCANINIVINLKHTSPTILRVYIRNKDSAQKEKAISDLIGDKLPVPIFHYIGEHAQYTFAITTYLPGIPLREFLLHNKHNTEHIMLEVGKALNTITQTTFPKSGFFDKNLHIAKNITTNDLIHFCYNTLKKPTVKSTLSEQTIKQIISLFETHQDLLPNASESNLVHGDFDPANILVNNVSGNMVISGILDWEFAFSGSSLFDIANMLRYAHKMPPVYQKSFLHGFNTYKLSDSWEISIKLLNILSLLDILERSTPEKQPCQTEDIIELIEYNLR